MPSGLVECKSKVQVMVSRVISFNASVELGVRMPFPRSFLPILTVGFRWKTTSGRMDFNRAIPSNSCAHGRAGPKVVRHQKQPMQPAS